MRLGWTARLLLVLLVLDAVVLAMVELFFLPLRLPAEHGGWVLPFSIVLAAVSTPMLVKAAADLAPRMLVAGLPLGAWVLTIATLGIIGPGGDLILPGDWRPLALIAAAVLPCGIVLGRMAADAVTAALEPGGAGAAGGAADRPVVPEAGPGLRP